MAPLSFFGIIEHVIDISAVHFLAISSDPDLFATVAKAVFNSADGQGTFVVGAARQV